MTKVAGRIQINAAKKKVWQVLAELGSVSAWNPAIGNSYYTSEQKEGQGASRHCDFPDGGYVKERVTGWKAEETVRLMIYEGTVPFDNFYGTYTLQGEGEASIVDFELEYDLKPDAPADANEIERQNRDELIPLVLASLNQFVETGDPMAMPADGAEASQPS
jgi:hypothetical protein